MSFKQLDKKFMESKPMKVYFRVAKKLNSIAEGIKDELRMNTKAHTINKKWSPSERKLFGLGKE